MRTARITFHIFNIVLLLILSSCAKEDEDQPNFIGEWRVETKGERSYNGVFVEEGLGIGKDTFYVKFEKDESGISGSLDKSSTSEFQWDLIKDGDWMSLTLQRIVDTTAYHATVVYEIIEDEPNRQVWLNKEPWRLTEDWEVWFFLTWTMTRIK